MGATIEKPVSPSKRDVELATESSRDLAVFIGHNLKVSAASGGKTVEVELPKPAVELLIQMLTEMAQGNAVAMIPIHAQLTTQQAANILGVSRPFVTEQMTNGKIPFQKVGTHRRIAIADLMKFRDAMAEESNKAMDELVSQAQELGMGY